MLRKKLLRIFACALSAAVLLSLTACGNQDTVDVSKDGGQVHYTLNQIKSKKSWGFYVMNRRTHTFTPLLTDVEGTASVGNNNDSSGDSSDGVKYFSWCDYNTKKARIVHHKLVPVVTKKNPLVYIQSSDSSMPDDYKLESYKYLGPTIGVKVGVNSAGNGIYMDPSTTNSHSSAATQLNNMDLGDADSITIGEISSGHRMVPVNKEIVNSVDTEIGTLMCFSHAKGKLFRFQLIHGTQTDYMNCRVDTQVFKYIEDIDLGSQLKTTDNGYFIVQMPKNIKSGLYYNINNSGIFKYK